MVTNVCMGGIGNCLFQISATLGYSMKWGMDYCIPTKVETPHYIGQLIPVFQGLNYCSSVDDMPLPVYLEQGFEYSEIPYMKDVRLKGYFQSPLYHYGYKKEILKLFGFDDIKIQNDTVFLHYRLGDYKHLSKFHKIISEEYISSCLSYFAVRGYKKFLVFSDEIEQAKKILNQEYFNFLHFDYSEGKTEMEDLLLMASCKHGIMSASSFSWWGAYIGQNEDRIILYPKDWFGESLSNHNTKDLCPKEWTAL